MGNLHYIPVLVTAEVTNNGESFSSWDNTNSYKPFTIVEYQGDFYLSIDNVPASTAISNTSYWYKISGSSSPSPTSIAWGNITGTLSNQTDLQSALNDKADTSSLATVATTGDYTDLTNTPNLAAVATTGDYTDLSNTPNLATVATTGDYSDLIGTPNLADYIIEEGSSGIWNYRKWENGISECWGTLKWTLTGQSSWGSMYYATPESTAQAYPSGLFISKPTEEGTINYLNGDVLTVRMNSTGSTTLSGRYYAMRPAGFGLNAIAELSLYAIGRWK